MYYLSKKKINNNIYFVVTDDETKKNKDFFLFGNRNIPNIEWIVFNIMNKTLSNIFESSRYNVDKYRLNLNTLYGIDLVGKEIDYHSCVCFRDFYLYLINTLLVDKLYVLKHKFTESGINAVKDDIKKIHLDSLNSEGLKKFNGTYSFFPISASEEEVFNELIEISMINSEKEAIKNKNNFAIRKQNAINATLKA